MWTETDWQELRTESRSLAEGAVIETPTTNRILTVEAVSDDGIEIHSPSQEGVRTLERSRFESLYEELEDGAMALSEIPPGAEPYAALLTLLSQVRLTDDRLVHDPSAGSASPLRKPSWEERAEPTRLHDDATLLSNLLNRVDVGSASVELLVDMYVLLSDVQHESGTLRKTVRDELLDAMDSMDELHGRFGSVSRVERKRRQQKDSEAIFRELDRLGIPREWVLDVDRQKLDVVVSVTDLEEADVYDIDEETYVQKTGVSGVEREAHLRQLEEQLTPLESDRAERLHDEVEALEERLESLLAAG